MTIPSRLQWPVPPRAAKSGEQPTDNKRIRRPPAGFWTVAQRLAASVGKDKQDLMDETGREGASTYERLEKGNGSLLIAHSIKAALIKWKADVATLPPLDDATVEGDEPWRREWIEIGELVHEHAPKEWLDAKLAELRRMANACETIRDELAELSRPNVSTTKPVK